LDKKQERELTRRKLELIRVNLRKGIAERNRELLLKNLDKLKNTPLTISLLKETRVVRPVKKLKENSKDPDVARKAKEIIKEIFALKKIKKAKDKEKKKRKRKKRKGRKRKRRKSS